MERDAEAEQSQVFRITGARQGLDEDVRGRQRRYVISMSVRTVSVILAATLWNVERHVAIVALVLGILLPYISVVIANAGRENAPSLPSTFVTLPGPAMIAPPRRTPPRNPSEDVVTDQGASGRRAARAGRARLDPHLTTGIRRKRNPIAHQAQEKLRSIMLFRCRAAGYP